MKLFGGGERQGEKMENAKKKKKEKETHNIDAEAFKKITNK